MRAAKGGSGYPRPSSHSRLPFSSWALIDISNGPKTPLSPATCICPATDAAAGRRPRWLAAGGTEPGAAHRGRAASLTQRPPRRAGGRPTPPCGRGGSRAAYVTPRRRLTHPAARSRAASRSSRPAKGHVTARLVAGEPEARGPGCAFLRACVRTCAPARQSAQVARPGSARSPGAAAPVFSRDSVGGSVEMSLSVTGSPHTTA